MARHFFIITKNHAEGMNSEKLLERAVYNFAVALNNQDNPDYLKKWHARPISDFYDALPSLRDNQFSGAAKKNFESIFRLPETDEETERSLEPECHTFRALRDAFGALPRERLIDLVTTSKEEMSYIATQGLLTDYLQLWHSKDLQWLTELMLLFPIQQRGELQKFYYQLLKGSWDEEEFEKQATVFMGVLLSKMEDVEVGHLAASLSEVFNKHYKPPSR